MTELNSQVLFFDLAALAKLRKKALEVLASIIELCDKRGPFNGLRSRDFFYNLNDPGFKLRAKK